MDNVHVLHPPAGRPATPAEAVDYIIAAALKFRASDIHFGLNQPTQEHPDPYLLRYRVQGKLQTVKASFLNNMYKEVVARLKILAEMPATEVGIPLDGQLVVDTGKGNIVLRISTVPSQSLDEVTIRVQRPNDRTLTLDQLRMTEEMRGRLANIIQQKSGLVVLNGPAGSGKTTTIYSILNTIASPEKKIITAEDPVEMRLSYVNHTQVTGKTDFASLSRSFMRQDADVIFIGEIRDEESAQTAMQLAQTGHLVFSTLHARDAIGAISRLEALNVHSNAIATGLIASLSQRLVPALCKVCKQEQVLHQSELAALHEIMPLFEGAKIFKAGPGCDKCNHGYAGRMPLFELFIVDSELSEAINRKLSKTELIMIAKSKGMTTLAEETLMRVYAGYLDLKSVAGYISGPDYKAVA